MKKGFTLVELLVVVAIIGLLAGIATVSVNSVRTKARDARRVADIKQIQNALEIYYSDAGSYPATIADKLGTNTALVLTSNGWKAAAEGTVYLNVPKDPQSVGEFVYTYSAAAPTKDYSIVFKLESGSGSFKDGLHTATSSGIQAGAVAAAKKAAGEACQAGTECQSGTCGVDNKCS